MLGLLLRNNPSLSLTGACLQPKVSHTLPQKISERLRQEPPGVADRLRAPAEPAFFVHPAFFAPACAPAWHATCQPQAYPQLPSLSRSAPGRSATHRPRPDPLPSQADADCPPAARPAAPRR